MLDGPLVCVDVDTQRDFMDPDGALAIADAGAIRPALARLTGWARDRGIPIVATACAHGPDDREGDFPPHCVVGTAGQARIPETAVPGSLVVGPGSGLVPGAVVPHLTIHKGAYDVFSTPEADGVFALYGRDRPTFVVYGVATDYCVRCAVDGLLARGHRVAGGVDASRPVDPAREAAELTGFAQAGALLTVADVVCGNGHP